MINPVTQFIVYSPLMFLLSFTIISSCQNKIAYTTETCVVEVIWYGQIVFLILYYLCLYFVVWNKNVRIASSKMKPYDT